MLGRDGAAVKSMMENFQHLHKHPLPEEHRRLVLTVDMYAHCTVDHTVTENMLSFVQLLAIKDLFNWNSE